MFSTETGLKVSQTLIILATILLVASIVHLAYEKLAMPVSTYCETLFTTNEWTVMRCREK